MSQGSAGDRIRMNLDLAVFWTLHALTRLCENACSSVAAERRLTIAPGFSAGFTPYNQPRVAERRLKPLSYEQRIISSVTAVTRCLLDPYPAINRWAKFDRRSAAARLLFTPSVALIAPRVSEWNGRDFDDARNFV
jgi:hypothetical protein